MNDRDETGGFSLELLSRVYSLWTKDLRLSKGGALLPKCEEEELEAYLKKHGDKVLTCAKKRFE